MSFISNIELYRNIIESTRVNNDEKLCSLDRNITKELIRCSFEKLHANIKEYYLDDEHFEGVMGYRVISNFENHTSKFIDHINTITNNKLIFHIHELLEKMEY